MGVSNCILLDELSFASEFLRISDHRNLYFHIEQSVAQRRLGMTEVVKEKYGDIFEIVSEETQDIEEYIKIVRSSFIDNKDSREDVERYVKSCLPLFIVSKEEKTTDEGPKRKIRIGSVLIMLLNNGSVFLSSFSIIKEERGKGYGGRSIRAMSELVFERKEFGWGAWLVPDSRKLVNTYEKYSKFKEFGGVRITSSSGKHFPVMTQFFVTRNFLI